MIINQKKIIVFDFAGTLIKPEIIDIANTFRSKILQRSLPTRQQHAHEQQLYRANREFVEKLTGITADAKIKYRQNDLREITLIGESVQNQIATNLFQIGMYMTAKKYSQKIFPPGLLKEIKKLKQKDYLLAIVSGIRTDIISGMLSIAGVTNLFDHIKGQPPKLGMTNNQLLNELKQQGKIVALIGDKYSDLEPGKELNVKTIFVTWGTPSGNEQKIADLIIKKPEELATLF